MRARVDVRWFGLEPSSTRARGAPRSCTRPRSSGDIIIGERSYVERTSAGWEQSVDQEVVDADGETDGVHAAVIPARRAHGHRACAHAAVLFVDGDSAASRRLDSAGSAKRDDWIRSDLAGVSVPVDPDLDGGRALVGALSKALDLPLCPPPRHPAVRRMCRFLGEAEAMDLASLSRRAGLSPRQMRHVFMRDVGLSLRGYVRWRRLRRAIAAVERGASLTDAAVAAGFADGAHLSRVFRRQFGISPTQTLGSITWRSLAAAP